MADDRSVAPHSRLPSFPEAGAGGTRPDPAAASGGDKGGGPKRRRSLWWGIIAASLLCFAFASAGWLLRGYKLRTGPMTLLVGSGTARNYLVCKTQLARPDMVMVPGGSQAALGIVREADSHGRRPDERVVVVGLSFGRPKLEDLASKAAESNSWVLLALDADFPLAAVLSGRARDLPELATRHCENPFTSECIDTSQLRAFVDAKRTTLHDIDLLIPEGHGGTVQVYENLLGMQRVGGAGSPDSRESWPDHKIFTMDYGEITNDAVALGSPTLDSGHEKSSACTPVNHTKLVGICDGGSCPVTPGLWAYFRTPKSCGLGETCSLASEAGERFSTVCDLFREIYTALRKGKYIDWAHNGCPVVIKKTDALVEPLLVVPDEDR